MTMPETWTVGVRSTGPLAHANKKAVHMAAVDSLHIK